MTMTTRHYSKTETTVNIRTFTHMYLKICIYKVSCMWGTGNLIYSLVSSAFAQSSREEKKWTESFILNENNHCRSRNTKILTCIYTYEIKQIDQIQKFNGRVGWDDSHFVISKNNLRVVCYVTFQAYIPKWKLKSA